MSNTMFSVITIAIVAGVSLLLRSFAFIAFPSGKKIPRFIEKLGDTLPYGIMAFLVIYCLKDITPLAYPYGIPEVISVLLVAVLQIIRRNSLLSVLLGTICYMLLVQFIF